MNAGTKIVLSAFLILAFVTVSQAHRTSCGCSDESLCQPLPRNLNKFEFVGFLVNQSPSVYKRLDWTKLTTIVVNSISSELRDLVCYARARKTKVMILTTIPTADLLSPTKRAAYVKYVVGMVVNNSLDGVNMDFEGNITPNGTASQMLTSVMQDLRTALSKVNDSYTLSMDYVYCASCIYGRTYEYMKLANIIDYFVLMDYDMQGAEYKRIGNSDLCYVLSNSPFPTIYVFTEEFMLRGVPPEKLVLAFPWYGYFDPCEKFDRLSQACYTNCSNKDMGMRQLRYNAIMGWLRDDSEAGRQWNVETLTPSYTFQYKGQLTQMNYDDPWSLKIKYDYIKFRKLRGGGIWHLNCLDYSNSTQAEADNELMWSAIPKLND